METGQNVIEIEAHYHLMQVFNAINEERSSHPFNYKGVKFWRENYRFVTERQGRQLQLGDIVDFDDFKKSLGIVI